MFSDKYDEEQYQPNGIDLRLESVEYFKSNGGECVGIYDNEKHLPTMDVKSSTNNTYLLARGVPYIINLGKHHIPEGFVGLFYIRSTFMRMGCILCSSVADMGYDGTLKMLFYNPLQDVMIEQNERIVQMVLYDADADKLYDGDYQNDKIYLKED